MTRKTILVVEDDQSIYTLLIGALGDQGYHVLGARDAAGARKILATSLPDLVLLDIGLPDVPDKSLSFLQEITKTYPNLLVAVLSAHRDYQLTLEAYEFGATFYFEKPFDLEMLEARIAALLRHIRPPT